MKAVITTKYGGPEVLQLDTVAKPQPKSNEVLVKIYSASITRAETMMRTGYPLIGRLFTGLSKPNNPISGTGFSGIVEAIGDEVSKFNIGDQVFGESLVSFGTYAEYICIDENGIITKKPHNIDHNQAAVVGDGGITSMNFLKKIAQIKKGQEVLIIGASGSLGSAAIQLAKHYGANVTGVCSAANKKMVFSLGADSVVDYMKEDVTQLGKAYDIIYDTVGKSSFKLCKKILTEEGKYMSPVLNFSLLMTVLWTSIFGKKKAYFSATGALSKEIIKSFLEKMRELIEANKFKSVIDKTYKLESAVRAHQYIDTGRKKGNVVFEIHKV